MTISVHSETFRVSPRDIQGLKGHPGSWKGTQNYVVCLGTGRVIQDHVGSSKATLVEQVTHRYSGQLRATHSYPLPLTATQDQTGSSRLT